MGTWVKLLAALRLALSCLTASSIVSALRNRAVSGLGLVTRFLKQTINKIKISVMNSRDDKVKMMMSPRSQVASRSGEE